MKIDILSKKDYRLLINIELPQMFLVQCAAGVIQGCRDIPVDRSRPYSNASGDVAGYMNNWAAHAFSNMLLSHANLLLEFAKEYDGADNMVYIEQKSLNVIAKALSDFQKWKDAMWNLEKQEYGEDWGSSVSFYTTDYTQYNNNLLN